MGVSASKVKCMYLPAQSGKTRKMEESIKMYKALHSESFTGSLDIVISANNRLLVHQTTTRFQNSLRAHHSESDAEADAESGTESITESNEPANSAINDSVFSWTCGNKMNSIDTNTLAHDIEHKNVKMVILCANGVRVRYLVELLNTLATRASFKKTFNIWIDEADKSINLWSKYPEILQLPMVEQVTLVSATFVSVFSKYDVMQVLPFSDTHPACYRRLADCEKHAEDCVEHTAVKYIDHVLAKHCANNNTLVRPGARAFIPGDYQKISHEFVANLLHKKYGFVVCIMNGARKEILVPGRHDAIDLHPYLTVGGLGKKDTVPEEFNVTLARIYKEQGFARYPFAVTGFYCVERGITFQIAPSTSPHLNGAHDGFAFDYCIIPPISKRAEAYQTMARVFGNIGDFPNYKPCAVYTTSAMLRKVGKQEDIAVNIGKLVQDRGITFVSGRELKEAAHYGNGDTTSVAHVDPATYRIYTDETIVRKVFKILERRCWIAQPNGEGFCEISVHKKKRVISLVEAIRSVPSGYGGMINGEKTYRTCYSCYMDKNDNTTLRYVVLTHPDKTAATHLATIDRLYPSIAFTQYALGVVVK